MRQTLGVVHEWFLSPRLDCAEQVFRQYAASEFTRVDWEAVITICTVNESPHHPTGISFFHCLPNFCAMPW